MATHALRLALAATLCSLACSAALPRATHGALVAPEAVLLGSGLSLRLPARPGKAYCLLSDPCLHVNALFAAREGPSGSTRVQGLGIRAGQHTLMLRSAPPEAAQGQALALAMLDYSDVRAQLAQGEDVRSEDGAVRVEVLEQGRAYLVTLAQCAVRLVVRVHALGPLALPHLALDALDWQALQRPHGLLGQAFPNHAQPALFHRGRGSSSASSAAQARADGDAAWPSRKAQASLAVPVRVALAQLQSLPLQSSELDGVPDDYLASGLLHADCLFSRFSQGDSELQAAPGVEGWSDDEEEEAEPSASTREHAARSAGAVPRDGPSSGAALAAAVQRRMDSLRGRQAGSQLGTLSREELGVIADTQGTREEQEGQAAGKDALGLSRSDLQLISSTQGTAEVLEAEAGAGTRAAAAGAGSKGAVADLAGSAAQRARTRALTPEEIALLNSMQGTLETSLAPEDAAEEGPQLTRAEAQLIASTQGTEDVAQGH